ncbi:urease accessory UreF family protein [Streptomyces sp. B-S-A8]|uniref:Urease accessory protein UreF n=1 Tax=Streptomyces solicavernae TaxID=3043614 RepID=A0ABT6RX44_9ACTN|nr:urease accessory UreF family protein [Streptomyces sp. B-S-A8]MDI3389013.1 urease accessory UreF family protein [Streptomyces sp. B-S-A8]
MTASTTTATPAAPTGSDCPPPPPAQGSFAALLLLADGRLPAGAHAHSGGLEAAVALEGIQDLAGLEAFLRGRVATVGHVAAAFAAAGCAAVRSGGEAQAGSGSVVAELSRLDDELEARTPSPALRTASRRLGRQLLRCALRVWPHSTLDELAAAAPRGPHQPVALGAVAAVADLEPQAVAWAAVHDAVMVPATAAVRLLGLDPYSVYAVLARLGDQLDAVATAAAAQAHDTPADLPARGAPLLDISAQLHATWEVRLFAS